MSENNDIMIPADTMKALAPAIEIIMKPFMEHMVKMVAANTEAMQQIANQSAVFANRLEALEKEVRLCKKITGTQKKYLNDAIADKAKELLDKNGVHDRDSVMKLSRCIRKSVLSRLGAASMADIPQHEYSVVMEQISIWYDFIKVREVVSNANPDIV